MSKKIVVVMPAYNVQSQIESVFKRIPNSVWRKIYKVVIINDGSKDQTKNIILKIIKKYRKVYCLEKKHNQGYAKAQKSGFKWALDNKADIVVLLHSDGQYAPEYLEKLLRPIEKNQFDIVQGSRILGGKALEGGMPLYKYFANRFLSYLENLAYGMKMEEYHSGYMLYSKEALKKIPFAKLSDTFHFDGEMILMANLKRLRIKQIPIPTKYGSAKSNLKPIPYGFQVLKIIIDYKSGKYHKL